MLIMVSSLKRIIEENNTKEGKIFDIFIQILIVLSLISFSVETLPNLSKDVSQFLQLFEIIAITIFSIEYLLRIIVASNKGKFIFSFYGIIDLLAILPFYLSLGIDLRSIRIFRLFRIIRMFKLARYSKAVQRFKKAYDIVHDEMVVFIVFTLILLYISSIGIYYFENEAQPEQFKSVFHSLWWSVSTLTTVGYGDIYPVTCGGRVFTFFVLLIGLGIVAVPSGLIASAFTKVREEESQRKRRDYGSNN